MQRISEPDTVGVLAAVAVAVVADLLAVPHLDLIDGRPPLDGDPFPGEHAGDMAGDFRVLTGEDLFLFGQDGHPGAEPGEDLGELHADRAGTDHNQALGNRRQRPERAGVEVTGLRQARNLRPGWPGASGDHEPMALDPAGSIEQDGVIGLEGSRAREDVDAPGAEGIVRSGRPGGVHHRGAGP